jgi:hypothetical protein
MFQFQGIDQWRSPQSDGYGHRARSNGSPSRVPGKVQESGVTGKVRAQTGERRGVVSEMPILELWALGRWADRIRLSLRCAYIR